MLQRIQSVYLFLAFLALLLLGTFPVLHFNLESGTGSAYSFPREENIEISCLKDTCTPTGHPNQVDKNIWHYVNLSIWAITGILILACIFLFKNRALQIRLCWVCLALLFGLAILIYWDITGYKGLIQDEGIGLGAYALSIIMLLLILSRRTILKDENLVRSVDRLR